MSTTRRFERNARNFGNYLSDLLTKTIAPNYPLRCIISGVKDEAFLEFRAGKALVGNGCSLRISHVIAPNPDEPEAKVTTVRYSYSYALGPDPDRDWLLRYEYRPDLVGDPSHPYALAHVHLRAESQPYTSYMAPHENKPLGDIHFPTGRISIEEFVRLLIVEFHIPTPGRAEQGALTFLDSSLEGFRDRQTRR